MVGLVLRCWTFWWPVRRL